MCSAAVLGLQGLIIFNDIEKCINRSFEEIEIKDEIMEFIEDKFDNMHTISSVLNGPEIEIEKCKDKSQKVMNARISVTDCIIKKQIDGYVSNTLVFAVILMYSYNLYNSNELTTEELTVILTTLQTLFTHVYEITYYIPDITSKIGVLNSNKKFIEELFSYTPKIGNDIEINHGIIKFNNVTFSYENNKIFDNFTKLIQNNKIIGIYGPSGSGKSTLVKLLCNILKPSNGTITIDNYNVNELSNNTLKKYILYISQNTSTLFKLTIYENIVYGMHNSESIELKNKIKENIKKYNLFKIFENINKEISIKENKKMIYVDNFDFLDYNVGKNGELLSGGQRQIIHLIRSILNITAKIIIYDEPTSALDQINRDNVIRLIKNSTKNRTVLIITHDENIKTICDDTIKIGNYESNVYVETEIDYFYNKN
jgi:ABC-type multidrug transport system fused ATPase/permease subunit